MDVVVTPTEVAYGGTVHIEADVNVYDGSVSAEMGNITTTLTNSHDNVHVGDLVISSETITQMENMVIPITVWYEVVMPGGGGTTVSNEVVSVRLSDMNCVYDRTLSDVNEVALLQSKMLDGTATDDEKAVWATDLKGALNTSDLTRIRQNMELLSTVMNIALVNATIPEIPNESYFASLLADLNTLYSTRFIYPTTPTVPESPLNTYEKWNAIEKIQHDVFTSYLSNTGDNYVYLRRVDSMYAGDEIVVI